MAIDKIKIFPPIGIARLGNSPDEFFIGPELPGDRTVPAGGYKDAHCRVKRQAARFRLYAFEGNNLVGEITANEADITWTVELANTKGEFDNFVGIGQAPAGKRNLKDKMGNVIVDRSILKITPGPRTLNAPNQAAAFNTGTFLGEVVPLGEMRTDQDGHLLVLGGFGNSDSPDGRNIVDFANNDGWHDDVCDGPVTATVKLKATGATPPVDGAWVVCPPPRFAPAVDNIVTLYDVLLQIAVDQFGFALPPTPSFSNDVYPLLQRAINTSRVSAQAAGAHDTLAALIPGPGTLLDRKAVFDRLRDPQTPANQITPGKMPQIWSDVYAAAWPNYVNETLTKTQYKILQQWRDDQVIHDWVGIPGPATQINPDNLTRAALENCIGGAFYPGIETSFLTRDSYPYKEPFRLDWTQLQPGDLTKQMAVPWQSDFVACAFDNGLLWWPAARPDDVFPEAGGPQVPWTRDLAPDAYGMIANWSKLGFLVEKPPGGPIVETERHKVCQGCFVILDRSTFGKDEVDGVLTGGSPAKFDDAFYVVVEGFTPNDLMVTGSGMTPAQLQPIAPTVSIVTPGNVPVPKLTASPQKVMLEDDFNLNALQRVTFNYRLAFDDSSAFVNESEVETLTATIKGFSGQGFITLNHQPNPFILHGSTTWLAIDLRVFQFTEGAITMLGTPMGNTSAGALDFIQKLLLNFNGLPIVNHPFFNISTNQQTSKLELSRTVKKKRVFNFAVAHVHYFGKVLPATDVRMFFRLFTTAATGVDFNAASKNRVFSDGTKIVPLLGFEGGHLVTIPCLAKPRVDSTAVSMTTQPEDLDEPNKKTLQPAGGNEVHAFFGCWLDFNQDEHRVPTLPFAGDGNYGPNAQSIRDAIRGLHQCLIAEINFAGQPIPTGATPASSDKLAQRNLMILESDNPGGPDSHTVLHTFELKPSQVPVGVMSDVVPDPVHAPRPARLVPTLTRSTALARSATVPRVPPDELMIRWYNLPRDTDVTLYIPSVDANALLKFAALRYDSKRLERVDDHTIRCRIGDVTYLPVPSHSDGNIPGLLTLLLPDTIRTGQFFRATVHQISGLRRQIIGSFQMSIPVKVGESLLEVELRNLGTMRGIGRSIQTKDRWRPVFDRYLAGLAGRVRGFGGNPDKVGPDSDDRDDDDDEREDEK